MKGGQYLIKETNYNDIFITEEFSEEQQLMKASLQEFINREVWPHKERFEKKDYAFTVELMHKIAEMGLLGISIDEKYGGMGMGFVNNILACDYISGASGSLGTAYGAHTGIGTMPIYLYGTETQKEKYLPKLVSGEWFGSYCLTEPEAGSDANAGKTKAVLSKDKKHYHISGQKIWISNAGFCSLMIVFARIENDENLSAFIIEYNPDKPNGITLGEEENKLGINASSTRQVFFNNTEIPVENMLSERNKGFKIALNVLNIGRIKLAAASLDMCRRIITKSVEHANERKQFNTPIANFGAIQYKLAEMATRTYASESATYRASNDIENNIKHLLNSGLSHQEAELKGVEEFAIECAMLKVYVSESGQYVSDEGIQVFGGMGFSKDTPMEAAWRDARITRIYEGTNEINRLLSVGMLLKKSIKGEIDLIKPAMEAGKELLNLPSFETPNYSKPLSEEKEMIAKLKKAFLVISGKALETHGKKLKEQQQLILAAAEIMIEIYIAESVILKTEKLIHLKNEQQCEVQIAMTKLCLLNAVETIKRKGTEGIVSFANSDDKKLLLMGLKRFTKYHNFPNTIELRKIIAKKIIAENKYCF